jgi:hypothetical protein
MLVVKDVAPLPLSYDDLPPGSDIRRVYDGDVVHITVPAGELPTATLKQAAHEALAAGAASSWALLLLAGVVFYFGIRINRISGGLLTLAWIFFAVFCAALVMLVCWIRYGVLIDALRAGRRQMTVIAASSQRLLIETAGPFGTASYDLPQPLLRRIDIARASIRDDADRPHRLAFVRVTLTDGRAIALLPGRDRRELGVVMESLQATLGTKPTEDASPGP